MIELECESAKECAGNNYAHLQTLDISLNLSDCLNIARDAATSTLNSNTTRPTSCMNSTSDGCGK